LHHADLAPGAVYGLKSMDGVIPKTWHWSNSYQFRHRDFPKKGNNIVREKVPAAPGGRYTGLVLLFSSENASRLRSSLTASCSACESARPTVSARNISPAKIRHGPASSVAVGRRARS